ncbi:hypothetical protein RJZ57_008514 [Blastomyces gilchristii]
MEAGLLSPGVELYRKHTFCNVLRPRLVHPFGSKELGHLALGLEPVDAAGNSADTMTRTAKRTQPLVFKVPEQGKKREKGQTSHDFLLERHSLPPKTPKNGVLTGPIELARRW